MPPRHAYWTIIIDNAPTAFRAREREDLLPTLNQLRRTNKDVLLKWFGRGKLWDTPEAAQTAGREPAGTSEKRGRDWRPGGAHKDPRDRFKKGGKRRDERPKTQTTSENGRDAPRPLPAGAQPWRDKPRGAPPAGATPWRDKPRGTSPGSAQPWRDKPRGAPPAGAPPWRDKPRGTSPGSAQPWRDKPRGAPPAGAPPWRDKPRSTSPGSTQRWRDKPRGAPSAGAAPWRGRPDTRHGGSGATSDPRNADPKKLEDDPTKKPKSPGQR